MEITAVNIVLLVVALLVLALAVYGIFYITNQRKLRSYQRIQQKYPSVQFAEEKIEYKHKVGKYVLKGKINGIPFVCFDFIIESEEGALQKTIFKFEHGLNLEDYTLSLTNEQLLYKIGKSLNMVKEIEIGISDFDKRFLIETSDEDVTKRLLTMQNREKITKIPKLYFGELEINNTELIYTMPYYLVHHKFCDYWIDAIEFSQVLLADLKHIKTKA